MGHSVLSGCRVCMLSGAGSHRGARRLVVRCQLPPPAPLSSEGESEPTLGALRAKVLPRVHTGRCRVLARGGIVSRRCPCQAHHPVPPMLPTPPRAVPLIVHSGRTTWASARQSEPLVEARSWRARGHRVSCVAWHLGGDPLQTLWAMARLSPEPVPEPAPKPEPVPVP